MTASIKWRFYTLWALEPWIVFVSDFTFTQENLLNFVVWIASVLLNLVYKLVWWVGIFDIFYMIYIHPRFHDFEANLHMSSLSIILLVIVHKKISKSALSGFNFWEVEKKRRKEKKKRSSKLKSVKKKEEFEVYAY